MSSSTVRRERLIGPLGLILLAGLFALAFFVLKPATVPGDSIASRLKQSGWSKEAVLSLDELDLAYIKAKQGTGEISDAVVVNVILTLIQAGRVDDGRQMLAQYPGLQIDAQSRSLIDLELAAAASDAELASALRQLENKPRRQSKQTLQRAIVLSKRLQQPALTQTLYLALASRRDVEQDVVFQQCGDYLALNGLSEPAARCYASALDVAVDEDRKLDVRLGLLANLPMRSAEQQALVDSLLNDENIQTSGWQKLAPALLAAERPEAAYRIYARLALADEARAAHWLTEAADWAQAANRLSDAAVFFDALAKLSDGEQRSVYLQEVIRVLVAAGQANEAFSRLQAQLQLQLQPGKWQTKTQRKQYDELLAKGITLARQLGKTRQALEWNTQRLALTPDNADLLSMQGELALAASDLALALDVAQHAVDAAPDDISARENLARVAEWNGQAQAASDQWFWLSRKDNQPREHARRQALRELVRLSKATFQSARGALALRELTLLEEPTADDVHNLVALYELEGQPHKATSALSDIMLVHGTSPFVLRTSALHQYQVKEYSGSLAAWQQYAREYGSSSESVIYQMELLWRLDRKEQAAQAANELRGRTLLSQASDYQLRLMAEISWQYRMPWLAALVQPGLITLEEYDMRTLYGRRSLEMLQEQGSDNLALKEAVRLWNGTGQTYFALSAMQLALKRDDKQALAEFLPEHGASAELQRQPDYWAGLARIRLRSGDEQAARAAYAQALKLDSEHVEAVIGTLWMDIASAEPAQLKSTLQHYAEFASSEPSLWQAMAVGYLELGAATISVKWFDKLLDQIDTDYGMLLTYADALEFAGRAEDAQRVRGYALVELRPVLARGSAKEQSLLLRQFVRLSTRYGASNDNEALVQTLVNDLYKNNYKDPQEAVWREDVAISWLMSTQRHEQARIVMTNMHARRTKAPAWQRLALALKDNDKQAIEAVVQTQGRLSVGNHILALRQLGRDREAFALAQQALQPGALNPRTTPADLRSIAQQYASMRVDLPSYVSATFETRNIAGIAATQRGVSVRHSLGAYPLGVGLDVSKRRLSASEFDYQGDDDHGDVALSLFFGNSQRRGRITAGLSTAEEGDQSYASTQWYFRSDNEKRLYSAEAAYREQVTNSGELYLGARQNRATASIDANLGALPYVRVQADATQLNTRVSEERFADGLAAQAELGVRGSRAGNLWSANVLAGQVRYQRSDTLPVELRLRDGSTVGSVLQDVSSRVSLGASLSRGTVNGGFAQSGTARYFLNARVGRSWPAREIGLSADAGAGFRVLGGDELSFSVSHDTQGVSRAKGTFTSMGVNYKYHF